MVLTLINSLIGYRENAIVLGKYDLLGRGEQ